MGREVLLGCTEVGGGSGEGRRGLREGWPGLCLPQATPPILQPISLHPLLTPTLPSYPSPTTRHEGLHLWPRSRQPHGMVSAEVRRVRRTGSPPVFPGFRAVCYDPEPRRQSPGGDGLHQEEGRGPCLLSRQPEPKRTVVGNGQGPGGRRPATSSGPCSLAPGCPG